MSLLDVYIKILAKIRASRLENVLPTIICEDQTGFLKSRQMVHNTHRLFHHLLLSHLKVRVWLHIFFMDQATLRISKNKEYIKEQSSETSITFAPPFFLLLQWSDIYIITYTD